MFQYTKQIVNVVSILYAVNIFIFLSYNFIKKKKLHYTFYSLCLQIQQFCITLNYAIICYANFTKLFHDKASVGDTG